MNTIPIGAGFSGINRAEAPHLLDSSQSPTSVDFAALNEVSGAGGRRYGRKRVAAFNTKVNGVVPFKILGQGRVVSFANGVWSPLLVPWALATPVAAPVYDQYDIGPILITSAGAGDYFSTTWNINPTPGYTNIILGGRTGQATPNLGLSSFIASWHVDLEAFDVLSMTWIPLVHFASGVFDLQLANALGAYSFNQLRVHVNQGSAGNINYIWNGSLCFINGSVSYQINA